MTDKTDNDRVLWAGRFEGTPEKKAFEFQASINVDRELVFSDIEGSIAHSQMLCDQGIINRETASQLKRELQNIGAELSEGTLQIDTSAEDIHSFIEGVLTKRLGDAGRTVHAGRSRNDQVAVDLRHYLKKCGADISAAAKKAINTLLDIAEKNLETIMPGFTHLQRAQPVTLAHHLCAWVCALQRDRERFADAINRLDFCPLGSGALAGSTLPLDRQAVSKALGFRAPTINSMDSVADRDFAIELASCCAVTQVHLSRFCEDLCFWSSEEFKFVEFSDSWSTGSSIMPQKKNPDFAELIRGKSGRTIGNLVTLLTMLKGLPYAYDKDLQEDKEALFDSLHTVENCLEMFSGMIASADFKIPRMRDACIGGFLEATDAAEYLVRKGMPFRNAHTAAAMVVRDCIAAGQKQIKERTLQELKVHSGLFEKDIYDYLDPLASVKSHNTIGGPAPEQVRVQIATLRSAVK